MSTRTDFEYTLALDEIHLSLIDAVCACKRVLASVFVSFRIPCRCRCRCCCCSSPSLFFFFLFFFFFCFGHLFLISCRHQLLRSHSFNASMYALQELKSFMQRVNPHRRYVHALCCSVLCLLAEPKFSHTPPFQIPSSLSPPSPPSPLRLLPTPLCDGTPAPCSRGAGAYTAAFTPEQLAEWMAEKQLLQLLLSDHLHKTPYVQRVQDVVRFLARTKLSIQDLELIWEVRARVFVHVCMCAEVLRHSQRYRPV